MSGMPAAPHARTIGGLLRDAAQTHPDRRALIEPRDPATGEQRAWTYGELWNAASAVAARLLERLQPGDNMAIWSANCPEWIILGFGASIAGIAIVSVHPAYQPDELKYVLSQSRSRGIFYNREYRGTDCRAVIDSVRADTPDLEFIEDIVQVPHFPAAPHALSPNTDPASTALILYTSGTTGKPKGVMINHGGMIDTQSAFIQRVGLHEPTTWLDAAPLSTISGSGFYTIGALLNQGTHLIVPQFDAGLVLRLIEEERVGVTTMVPTMAIMALEHPEIATRDMSSLRLLAIGGTAVPREVADRVQTAFPADICMIYGMTEAMGVITTEILPRGQDFPSQAVGYPVIHEMQIQDPATGAPLAADEVGEICLRGPAMTGYFEMPELSAQTIDADGWLHTGDLGSLSPDGRCSIFGRLKDMVIRGGMNIYPIEIENVLLQHPAIQNAAVFGVPDPKWGEVLVAAVIPHDLDTPPDFDDLKQFLRNRLARFKVPDTYVATATLPLNSWNKVQKFVLKDRYLGGELG